MPAKEINMATITNIGFDLRGVSHSSAALRTTRGRARQIPPEAGHALEILGHAIEYLTDELVQESKRVDAHDPQVEAIQMLMALNRQVYYECSVAPTFREQLRAFFHRVVRTGVR